VFFSFFATKVRESVVRDNNDRYYSLELRGPLLPHVSAARHGMDSRMRWHWSKFYE